MERAMSMNFNRGRFAGAALDESDIFRKYGYKDSDLH